MCPGPPSHTRAGSGSVQQAAGRSSWLRRALRSGRFTGRGADASRTGDFQDSSPASPGLAGHTRQSWRSSETPRPKKKDIRILTSNLMAVEWFDKGKSRFDPDRSSLAGPALTASPAYRAIEEERGPEPCPLVLFTPSRHSTPVGEDVYPTAQAVTCSGRKAALPSGPCLACFSSTARGVANPGNWHPRRRPPSPRRVAPGLRLRRKAFHQDGPRPRRQC